jgi:hypothetical protein
MDERTSSVSTPNTTEERPASLLSLTSLPILFDLDHVLGLLVGEINIARDDWRRIQSQ